MHTKGFANKETAHFFVNNEAMLTDVARFVNVTSHGRRSHEVVAFAAWLARRFDGDKSSQDVDFQQVAELALEG